MTSVRTLFGIPRNNDALRIQDLGFFFTSITVARWVASPNRKSDLEIVEPSEKARFVAKLWQAGSLLQRALEAAEEEGWELVSTSYSGVLNLYGVAVLRRPRES